MRGYWRIIVRVILTIVFGLFSLPPFIFGGYLFYCWVRIHTADLYYVEYPYLSSALILIGLGSAGLLSTLYGAWHRSFYGLLFCLPLMFGMMTMVAIPDAIPHIMRSMIADSNYLSTANSFLREWYESNYYKFPSNEAEFREAMTKGPAAWGYRVQSPPSDSFYSRRGTRLPYEIVVVRNARGPYLNNPSQRPGVIYYCVSADQQAF